MVPVSCCFSLIKYHMQYALDMMFYVIHVLTAFKPGGVE